MAIITQDLLLEGVRRDVAFAWLSQPETHEELLRAFCPDLKKQGKSLHLLLPTKPRARELVYTFDRADQTHSGHRVIVKTHGKRLDGQLNFSLRTVKPSSNTMVTLRFDYNPGARLGVVANKLTIAIAMRECLQDLGEQISTQAPR